MKFIKTNPLVDEEGKNI